MPWVMIDTDRATLLPYSTQLPVKAKGWWHEPDCQIQAPAAQCTCAVGAPPESLYAHCGSCGEPVNECVPPCVEAIRRELDQQYPVGGQ